MEVLKPMHVPSDYLWLFPFPLTELNGLLNVVAFWAHRWTSIHSSTNIVCSFGPGHVGLWNIFKRIFQKLNFYDLILESFQTNFKIFSHKF